MSDPTIPAELDAIRQRLDAGDRRMKSLEDGLRENTESTKRVEANTAEMLEVFEAAKGAFKVFGWIARAARPVSWIAGAAAAILAAWSTFRGHR